MASAPWRWRSPRRPAARPWRSAARRLTPCSSFLINGFAPLVDGLHWLKYLSAFYYYEGSDPIGNGVDVGHLAVLAAATTALVAFAALAIGRRDLRA